MAAQIDHLVSVSRFPNVRLSVLPLVRRVTDAPFHTFVTYDDRLMAAELFSGQVVLRDPKDVDYCRELFVVKERVVLLVGCSFKQVDNVFPQYFGN